MIIKAAISATGSYKVSYCCSSTRLIFSIVSHLISLGPIKYSFAFCTALLPPSNPLITNSAFLHCCTELNSNRSLGQFAFLFLTHYTNSGYSEDLIVIASLARVPSLIVGFCRGKYEDLRRPTHLLAHHCHRTDRRLQITRLWPFRWRGRRKYCRTVAVHGTLVGETHHITGRSALHQNMRRVRWKSGQVQQGVHAFCLLPLLL